MRRLSKDFITHLVRLNEKVTENITLQSNTEIRVNNCLDSTHIIQVEKHTRVCRVTININDLYAHHETDFQNAVKAILTNKYQKDNFPNIKDYVLFTEHNTEYPSDTNESIDTAGAKTGSDVISLTRAAARTAASYVIMQQVEQVFGAGVLDQVRKVRDRRFKKFFILKSVPKCIDALLMQRKAPKEIALYIDTSGSIGFYESIMATAVVHRFEERYPNAKLHFYTFSTDVVNVSNFSWLNIRRLINGGTRLKPVAEHIRKHNRRINVIIGDMYFNEISDEVQGKRPWDDILDKTVFISTVNHSDTDEMFERLGGNKRLCFKPA